MKMRNTSERYGALSLGMHWLMAALIVAAYLFVELHEFFPKGSAVRNFLHTGHFMLGLSILLLVLIRIVIRLTSVTPVIVPEPPRLQNLLAKAAHLALYAFMLAMPLIGWSMLSAGGHAIPFFGLSLPPLLDVNKALAHQLHDYHEIGANIGYGLVGLHALAGLYHHYFVKDNTLRRMLPQCNGK